MRIDEVIKTGADNYSQSSVEYSLAKDKKRFDKGEFEDTGITVGNMPVYEHNKHNWVTFIVVDEAKPVARVEGAHRKYKLFISLAGVSSAYKRKGLMTELYKKIAQQVGIDVVSDENWTKGSEMLWKKLIAEPNVSVNVYDKETDEITDLRNNKLPKGFFQDKNLRLILQGN